MSAPPPKRIIDQEPREPVRCTTAGETFENQVWTGRRGRPLLRCVPRIDTASRNHRVGCFTSCLRRPGPLAESLTGRPDFPVEAEREGARVERKGESRRMRRARRAPRPQSFVRVPGRELGVG